MCRASVQLLHRGVLIMDHAARLRQIVAPLAGVSAGELQPSSQLGGRLKTSIGRATLDALLRREFGIHGLAAYKAATFGELENAVLGTTLTSLQPENMPKQLPRFSELQTPAAACGIDIELIENLPKVGDYWTADFYQAHFTQNEIAYCTRQEDPREHFAVRWCAKESLKKCDPRFLSFPLDKLEVLADESGRVHISVTDPSGTASLPHVLSVSHTSIVAVAVVLLPPSLPAPPPFPERYPEERSDQRGWGAIKSGASGRDSRDLEPSPVSLNMSTPELRH